jgi:hypothetical protein
VKAEAKKLLKRFITTSI